MATSNNVVRSMTAFHRQDLKEDWGDLTCEIKSVNHRYLEPSFRLPENLRALETQMREVLRKRLARGKIEVNLRFQHTEQETQQLKVNTDLVSQLVSATRTIQQSIGITDPEKGNQMIDANEILRWPGVIVSEDIDQEAINKAAIALFTDALTHFIAARKREGGELKIIVEQRLTDIATHVALVRQKLPAIIQRQKERLTTRLAELAGELDNDRVEQEMVYISQKVDVDEELDRLQTHVDEVARVLNKGGPCGRRLDFLMQELNREANTLGSKSIDAQTSQASVELKVCIEQMREQIQNME